MRRLFVLALTLFLPAGGAIVTAEEAVFEGGQWVDSAPAGSDTPEGKLALARKWLREQKPRKALGVAEDIVDDHPNHPVVEEAMNIAGQAEIDRRNWWDAYGWYEKQAGQFPAGPLFENAMMRESLIGEAFLAGEKRWLWGFIPLGMKEEAIEMLDRVAERMPDTPLAERSLMRVADYLYQQKRWQEAADAYQQYEELFRGRYRSREAEHKAANATYNRFRGVQWSDTALVEAEQRFVAYIARYPVGPEHSEVVATLAEIDDLKAEKEYRRARFYERVDRSVSAAFYHRKVIERYPGSRWAARSAKALERKVVTR